MRQAGKLALAVLGVLGVMAVAFANASTALPKILNEKGEETAQTLKTAAEKTTIEFSILGGFGITKCSELSGEYEFEAGKPLGPFHLLLGGGCTTNLGGTCTGLGDTAGTRLVLGSWHLVFDTLGATLGQAGVAMLYLLQHVHYQCTVAGVEKLILLLGEILCLVKPVNTLTRTFTVDCLGTGGDPKETTYWNEGGTQVNIAEGYLASENEGISYKMAAQAGEYKLEFTNNVEIRT